MGLAIDSSTPAFASAGSFTGGGDATTASFTAPANSLLLVLADAGSTSSDGLVGSAISDSGGLTWTLRDRQRSAGYDEAAVWWAVTSSATPRTITLHGSTDNTIYKYAQPFVITGANNASPLGNSTKGQVSSGTLSASLTCSVTGSMAFCAYADFNAGSSPSAGIGTTKKSGYAEGSTGAALYKTATGTSGSTMSVSTTIPIGSRISYVLVEVKPSTTTTQNGTASLGQPATVSAVGTRITSGSATLSATQAASLTPYDLGAASLGEGTTLSATGLLTAMGAGAPTQASTVSASALLIAQPASAAIQTSTVNVAAIYVAEGAATLGQGSAFTATAGYAAILTQPASLTASGSVIPLGHATLNSPPSLSLYGFVYYFADSFRATSGFGSDLNWLQLAEGWSNAAFGRGTCASTGAVGFALADRDAPGSDMSVRVNMDLLTDNRSIGVIARANAAATSLADLNGYVFDVHGDSGGIYYLLKVVAGTVTVMDGPVLLPVTGPATIAISVAGNEITVLFNGVSVNTYTDSTITTGTRAGLISYNGNNAILFSNFAVGESYTVTTIYPAGIASTAAVGSPSSASGSVTTGPAGIASTAIIGSPVTSSSVVGVPDGVNDGGVVGTPSASTSLRVTPAGIAATLAVGSPTVASEQTAAAGGVGPLTAVGAPTIHTSVTVAPDGVASSAALGVPTAHAGPVTVRPSGLASQAVAGSPTADATVTLDPDGVSPTEAVGSPSIHATLMVSPAGLNAGGGAVGTPDVSTIVGVRSPGIPAAWAVGTPSARRRNRIFPTGRASTAAVGTPKAHSTLVVRPVGIPPAETLGSPTARRVTRVTPVGIPPAETFGSLHVGGSVTATAQGIYAPPVLGKPTATPGRLTGHPAGIPSAWVVGTPTATRSMPANPPRDRIRRLAPVHRIMDE